MRLLFFALVSLALIAVRAQPEDGDELLGEDAPTEAPPAQPQQLTPEQQEQQQMLNRLFWRFLETKTSENCNSELRLLQSQQSQESALSAECEAEIGGLRKQFMQRLQKLQPGVHPETLLDDEGGGGAGAGEGAPRAAGGGGKGDKGSKEGGEPYLSPSAQISLQVLLVVLLPICFFVFQRIQSFRTPEMQEKLKKEREAALAKKEHEKRKLEKKRKAGKIKDDVTA